MNNENLIKAESLKNTKYYNTSYVIVSNPNTGEILAMASYPTYDPSLFIGGINKEDWNQLNNNTAKPMFNRAIQATRQTGSSSKPIAVLLPAIDKKLITSSSIYKDEKAVFDDSKKSTPKT